MAASDHALLVGINGYSKLQALHGPEADALAVEAWLKDRNGGNVPDANITTILSSKFDPPRYPTHARPMSDDVRAELERLIDESQSASGRWRRLYLYLAGHGFGPSIDETALLMANASLATLHHIPSVRYANYFREAPMFSEVVLTMDCCRDHYERPPLADLGLPPVKPRTTEAAYFFAFATKWTLRTRESVDASGAVRGHFTKAMLEALDQSGATSHSVCEYVLGRLPELAGRRGYYPPEFRCGRTISFGSRSRGDAGEPDCLVNVTFSTDGRPMRLRIIDSDEQIVAEAEPDQSPWSVPLPRGLYELLRSDRVTQRVPFRVPASGAIDVAA
jgi:hypothetical protein